MAPGGMKTLTAGERGLEQGSLEKGQEVTATEEAKMLKTGVQGWGSPQRPSPAPNPPQRGVTPLPRNLVPWRGKV